MEEVQNLIGGDDPASDWQLRPRDHAASLLAEAGALKRILLRPEVQQLIDQFTDADQKAVRAQRRYKGLGRTALILYAAAAILGLAMTALLAIGFGADLRAAAPEFLAIYWIDVAVGRHLACTICDFPRGGVLCSSRHLNTVVRHLDARTCDCGDHAHRLLSLCDDGR